MCGCDDLDQVARGVLRDAGASSPFLGYQPSFAPTPYPGVVCLSVNDAVLHGIPDRVPAARRRPAQRRLRRHPRRLDRRRGDLVLRRARPRADDARLLERTEHALRAGIAAARDGRPHRRHLARRSAPSRARPATGCNTDFGGHGVGRTMHESPHIPNDGRPGRGCGCATGLTIAIEPWFLAGGRDAYRIDDDGWTLRSADGSRGAHFEHTIAVTDDGPRVLTAPATVIARPLIYRAPN